LSKEIAQTVSGPKIAWLLAIVAAFAVIATLGTQWRGTEAALPSTTVTLAQVPATPGSVTPGQFVAYTMVTTTSGANTAGPVIMSITLPAGLQPATSAFTGSMCPGANVGGAGITWAQGGAGTATLTCTSSAQLTAAITGVQGTMSVHAAAAASGTVAGAPTAGVRDNDNVTIPAVANSTVGVLTITGVTVTTTVGVAGFTASASFVIPPGLTYCSDPTVVSGATPRAYTAADGGGTAPGIVHTPTAANNNAQGTHTATATGPGTITISTRLVTSPVGTLCTPSTATLTAANFLVPELRHIDDNGDYIFAQEIANNVRGSRHTACFVAQDTAVGQVAGIPVNVGTNFATNFTNQPANAYNGPQPVIPQSPTANDVSRFIYSGNGNANGASCVSWYSTGAGDQILTASYVGLDLTTAYDVRWDNTGTGQRGLVKEWNVLEDSVVSAVIWTPATGSQTAQTSTQNLNSNPVVGSPLTINLPLFLNPNGGYYDFNGSVFITDLFGGSHVNSGGQLEDFPSPGLVGVNWTVSVTGDCGFYNTNGATGTTTLDATGTPVGSSFVTAGGPAIEVYDFSNCVFGDEIIIEITGSEGALGSGTGLTVRQRVIITFTIPPPGQKQVFLAWAGQRIVLEHDWRIGPGDFPGSVNPIPAGVCPFYDNNEGPGFPVTYIKGSGPGNFLTGLGAMLNGSDQATVFVWTDNVQYEDNIPFYPNDNCISRVLFESEDQGQVDIEAFVDDFFLMRGFPNLQVDAQVNVTKHAFVIYYMKLNTVTTSLVTQVSKPNHNSTSAPDWVPSNPWNSSLDDADGAAEWNVSKDILARVRVTGWFLTTNPSGRPADTSNPLNILPANRWVMPDDWAQLNGGPIDVAGLNETTHNIGTAEEFRPYYDLMIAPNNAAGLALTHPNGTAFAVVGVVAAANPGVGSVANPLRVVSCVSLTPGTGTLVIGTTSLGSVVSCTSGLLVVTSPLAAPAAAGALIITAGIPFEGPYSLLDILGLAAQNGGNAGAALSNLVPGSTRDTTWSDGDVDAWDAPMPPAMLSIKLRGTGFLKPVVKSDVYYLGTANTTTQTYPNPYYIQNIPDSPFIPAVVVGGGYLWNSWGNDGPGGSGDGVYRFWDWAIIGSNSAGIGETLSAADVTELGIIGSFHGAVARDAVVYTDNHGEAMFAANGDFKTDLTACATNALAGGKHCKPGDKVGTATITATADYPDFRGKHFPVLSNAVTVDWLWGGYKDVTVHPGETDQFKYLVFHAMDRDAFCTPPTGAISLHSVLTSVDAQTNFSGLGARYNFDPAENIDFLIDSGEGIIIGQSGGGTINDGRQFATGVTTFSVAANNPATSGILEFPLSPLAAEGQTDECQAWIKVSNSLLGIVNILTIAHDDEGNIGFDRVIDLSNTMSYTLSFRWSLITWAGADGIAVSDAITGTGTSGKNPGGNDISSSVTAIYGWNAAAQQWLGFFPSGVNVPGANDLTSLNTGDAYWIAITGPSSVTWTIATNIN